MSETSSSARPDAFWGIVIGHAARDEHIKRIVEWIFVYDLNDVPIIDSFYRTMGKHLVEKYGLDEEFHKNVYNQCENNMLEETLQHGQA